MNTLEVKNLNVSIDGQAILKNFNLTVPKGEVHALMGPNGTGKSTLAKVMAGHEDYEVESGEIFSTVKVSLAKRLTRFPTPAYSLPFNILWKFPASPLPTSSAPARTARLPEGDEINAVEYYKELYAKMDALKMDRKFTARSLNEGFSGGEKKRCEILQMSMLDPKYCVMDETDSGLDIDALRIVSEGVNLMRSPERGFLIITHYQRLLDYIVPDVVHVMFDGRIVHSGDAELAKELESKGYDWVKEEFATATA